MQSLSDVTDWLYSQCVKFGKSAQQLLMMQTSQSARDQIFRWSLIGQTEELISTGARVSLVTDLGTGWKQDSNHDCTCSSKHHVVFFLKRSSNNIKFNPGTVYLQRTNILKAYSHLKLIIKCGHLTEYFVSLIYSVFNITAAVLL